MKLGSSPLFSSPGLGNARLAVDACLRAEIEIVVWLAGYGHDTGLGWVLVVVKASPASPLLLPGHLTMGVNINSGATLCLAPGVYYLDGTWNVNGRLSPYGGAGCPALPTGVTDAGVLLYFHGGTLQLNSTADLSTVRAMATGPYAGVLYWQVSSSAVYENAAFLGGAWYEPAGSLALNSGSTLSASRVIVKDLTVNAGATLAARTGG
jgi:hypothetical protein